MNKPLPAASRCSAATDAFSLVELLIAIAVLSIILVMTLQMVTAVTRTTSASSRQMDAASMARIALDRFGSDFEGAVLNGGATALYYPGDSSNPNSAIGFLTKARPRGHSEITSNTQRIINDIRGVVVGYRIVQATANLPYPSLRRGDARFTFSEYQDGNFADFNVARMLGTAASRLPSELTSSGGLFAGLLVIGTGIFSFHISFVLNDGTVVQTPPTYSRIAVNGNTGSCTPIAFTEWDSTTGASVRGLIVGIALLDSESYNLARTLDPTLFDPTAPTNIASQLGRPTQDGETPVAVWSRNLPNVTTLPVRRNLRFFQRFYSVNR